MAIWVIKDGQREGPYEEEDVRELVYEGTYADSNLAIRDGQFDWSTLGQVLNRLPAAEIEPQAAPAEPESAPAAERSPYLLPPPPLPPEPPPIPAAETEEAPAIPPAAPQELPAPRRTARPMQVSVVDFQMPFGSMVVLMVKWALASIPALLVVGAIAAVFWTLFFALVSAVVHH